MNEKTSRNNDSYAEPELTFTTILSSLVTRHFSSIFIQLKYKSPWFVSEAHDAYRKKKRADVKWKESG